MILSGVKLLKVCIDFELDEPRTIGDMKRGIAIFKIGIKKYKVGFVYREQAKEKIFLTNEYYSNIPKNEIQKKALLVLIYAEIKRYNAIKEMIEILEED